MPVVLVIDDSATFRASLAQALRREGYQVEGAATGEEGLRAATRVRPDVIVVDRVLPDLDGTMVIRNIRLDPAVRRTPCLLVTADEDPSVEFAALETGADAYVQKDADVTVLLARVAALRRGRPRATAVPESHERRRILVVAADAGPASSQAMALPDDEYDLVRADGVERAAALIGAGPLDAVIIAMSEPARTAETIRTVARAARARHVPLLALAAADNPAEAVEALAYGADDYVLSSSEPTLYLARLRAMIRRKEVEAEDRRISEELVRHEAETAAARLRAEMAERENEFKSRFLAIMSHELRTPLNAILGFTQILSRGVGGELSESQRKHLTGVVRSAEHLLALVNDVLDLSTIRAGKLTLRSAPVALSDVVESVQMTVGALAEQRSIELTMDVPPGLPRVLGDAVRIQQILFNLISNGIKFTPEGGRVTLTGALERNAVRLQVRDTGIGIKPEDIGRLFKDFERLEDGRSQRADGTGLGLSLTKHLVELHGGRIEVRSEVGKGTEFSVWLPVFEDDGLSAPPA